MEPAQPQPVPEEWRRPPEDGISAEFPFPPRFVEVLGSKLHYVEAGEGDPVLFLHGNPTSSYLWRNILPHLSPLARVIAPDLVGMGRSDQPAIPYRFLDHARHVEGLIAALDLRNLTLVLHDWGSALGFHYARRHPGNVKGLAFMEAILRPLSWRDFPLAWKLAFRLFRAPGAGWLLISVLDLFVRRVLPRATVRPLTKDELRHYAAPFPTVASRRPVRQWPREIPIDGRPADVHEAVAAYSRWLGETDLPKLLLHGYPGGLNPRAVVEWAQAELPNLTTVQVGRGLHYLQEDHPRAIGTALARWYRTLEA